MKVKEAVTLFQYYQRSSYKKRTIASYLCLLKKFESLYGERLFDSMEAVNWGKKILGENIDFDNLFFYQLTIDKETGDILRFKV